MGNTNFNVAHILLVSKLVFFFLSFFCVWCVCVCFCVVLYFNLEKGIQASSKILELCNGLIWLNCFSQ